MSNKEGKSPKKPRAKQIKLSHIEKQNKDYNKLSTYVLDEESNLQIKYYESFGYEKIESLLEELYKKAAYAEENNIVNFNDNDFFLRYVHFLIIKHFTSLKDEIPNDLESQINIMEQIYNIGLFERIFDEILSPAEVEKVIEKIESLIVNLSNALHMQEKEIKKTKKIAENKGVIHPLVNPRGTDKNG